MAELALESVTRIIILLVAAGVILSLILFFHEDMLQWWKGFTEREELPKAEVIKKNSFTADEVAKFIEGCWATHAGSTKDNECYFLLGSFSGVTPDGIKSRLSASIIAPSKVIFEVTAIGSALAITYDNYRQEAGSEAIVVKG